MHLCRRAFHDSCRGAEQPDDLVGDLTGRRSDIDHQGILVRRRVLQRIDLALQQARRHEMAVAAGQVLGR